MTVAEVGSAFVSILPSAKGFGPKLQSQVGGEVDAAGRTTGNRFGAAFKIGALAAAGAAIAAGKFFSDAIQDASDVSESASKVGVVFGKQAKSILKASKTSSKAVGLSTSAYLEATGTLGNLLVSLDIAPKKSAKLSKQMVKLAGDLASFNNVSPEEALDALRAGLTGETEPLKKFGVNMNDATLKAQALKMGLISSTKDALTPQNKALAAQALIMAQTKTAQGDLARTSGGLANQQRLLSNTFADIKAKIGAALLPAFLKVVTFINERLLPAFGTFRDRLKVLRDRIATIFNNLNLGPAIKKLVDAFKNIDLSGVGKTLAQQAKGWVAPVIDGFKAGLETGDWSGLGAALGEGLVQAIKAASGAAKKLGALIQEQLAKVDWVGIGIAIGKQAPSFFVGLVAGIASFDFMGLLRGVAAHWQEILIAILAFAFAPTKLVGALAGILGKIPLAGRLLEWAVLAFKGLADRFLSAGLKVLAAFGRGVAQGIARVIPEASGSFGKALTFLFREIPLLPLRFRIWVLTAMQAIVKAIFAGVKLVGQPVGLLIGAILKPFTFLASKFFEAGASLIGGLISGIKSMLGPVGTAVGKVASFIKGFFPGSPVKRGPLTSWNRGGAGKRLVGLLADGLSNTSAVESAAARLASGVQLGATRFGSPAFAGVGFAGGQQVRGTLSIDRDGVAYLHGVSRREISGYDSVKRAADRAAALGGADFR